MEHAVTREAALRTFGPMSDRAEGGFNRVARPYSLPVLCREVVERHQLLAVFLQAEGGLRVFRFIRSGGTGQT